VLVEAKIVKPNEIELSLGGAEPDGFGIHLDKELVDLDKEGVVREDGEELFRGKVNRTLTSLLMCAAEKYDARNLYPVYLDLSG
ncbi:MAG: hypothetical protein ACYTHK_13465, partial [Planctomycetota bacterium]|jgi:hypothetical protein